MKYDNLKAFVKHVEDAAPDHLGELYVLLAKDAYQRKCALEQLVNALPNCSTHSAEKGEVAAVLNDLNTFSLFGEKRTVILHSVDKLPKPATEKLCSYIANPSPLTTLVLTAPTLSKNSTFYKKCEKQGIVLDIPELKPWEKEKMLHQWALERVGTKTLEPNAAISLIKHCGQDQALLEKEIEKLLCFVGERRAITAKDVATITNSVNSETAWQLGEAIFQRKTESALRISQALLQEGVPFLSLIRQIRSQLQTEYQVCTIMATTGNRQEITVLFPYMRGNLLEKHIANANAYGLKRFSRGLLRLDAIEMLAKNGTQQPELLFDLLIGHLTR